MADADLSNKIRNAVLDLQMHGGFGISDYIKVPAFNYQTIMVHGDYRILNADYFSQFLISYADKLNLGQYRTYKSVDFMKAIVETLGNISGDGFLNQAPGLQLNNINCELM